MAPDFSRERAQAADGVCGVDEAGRGPLAGPVLAAAVILPRPLPSLLRDHLDDSKRLSAARRVQLFDALTGCAAIGVGRAEVAEIDRINILRASLLAMQRAVAALVAAGGRVSHALIDGNQAPSLAVPLSCIIGGDGLSLSIAAASIIAKVTRDREMMALATVYPGYGWERNAGYGTAQHLTALRQLGVTPLHRRSFAPVAALLGNPRSPQ